MAGRRQTEASPESPRVKPVEASKAPAISRAAAVLRMLGKSDIPLPAQAIARELGLVPSTCLYILRALVAEGLVALDPQTKRYSLDAGVLTLARDWLRRNRVTDFVQPVLDRLGRSYGASVFCVQVFGLDHVVVVAVSQAGRDFEFTAQIGARYSALLSATGRCVAAFGSFSDDELKARFAAHHWRETPPFEAWQARVRQTREDGIAIDEGEFISGTTVLAAPVWKARGDLTHALVALGLSSNFQRPDGLAALKGEMLAASRTLSRQLCGEELPSLS